MKAVRLGVDEEVTLALSMPRNRCWGEVLLAAIEASQNTVGLFQASSGKAVIGHLLYAQYRGQQADMVLALRAHRLLEEKHI